MRCFARGIRTCIILLFMLSLMGGVEMMAPNAFAAGAPQQLMQNCNHGKMLAAETLATQAGDQDRNGKTSQDDCRCGCICALMHVSSFTTPANATIIARLDIQAVSYAPSVVTSLPASAVTPPSPPPIS